MSKGNVILSKKVRPGFRGKLLCDDSPENPREWAEPLTAIRFWGDRNSDLPASQEIRSYEEALHELYKNVYPELIDRLLDDEPPPEVLELIDRTEYPGVALWLTCHGGGSHDTLFHASTHTDPQDRYLAGIAFIGDENIAANGMSRDEADTMLRNEILTLELYINGHVYLLKVTIDGESEYHGGIYPLEEQDGATGRIRPMVNAHIPSETMLDEYLQDAAQSDEDRALIPAKRWK